MKPGWCTRCVVCVVIMWIVALGQAHVHAQDSQASRYFTQGADVTSVPKTGQPGAEFFNRGAEATSVPKTGQPGAEFFNRGAEATSVPKTGQPGAEFFNRGAEATSVPKTAGVAAMLEPPTDIDAPTETESAQAATTETPPPTDEAKSDEAESAEAPDEQPAGEQTADEATEGDDTTTEGQALPAAIEWLFAPWPTVVEARTIDQDEQSPPQDSAPIASDDRHLDEPAFAEATTTERDSDDTLRTSLHRFVFGVRIVTLTLFTLLAIAAFGLWRAFRTYGRR